MLNEQIDAFATPPAAAAPHSPRVSRQQRAKVAGELGMAKAEESAVRADDTFRETARAFVIAHLTKHGETCGEDLTDEMKEAGINPPDDRAFGAVYAFLSRRKLIRCVRIVSRSKGHGVLGARVWALT